MRVRVAWRGGMRSGNVGARSIRKAASIDSSLINSKIITLRVCTYLISA